MTLNQFLLIDYRLLQDERLTPTDKILMAYFQSWFRENKPCKVSDNNLAKTLGLSRSSVIRSVYHLLQLNLIKLQMLRNGRLILPPDESELEKLFDSVYEKIKRSSK